MTQIDALTARLRDATLTDNPYVGEDAEERFPNREAREQLARTFVAFAHASADMIDASMAAKGADLAIEHFEITSKALAAARTRDFLVGLLSAETAGARFEATVDGVAEARR